MKALLLVLVSLFTQASFAETRLCEDKEKSFLIMVVSKFDGTPDLMSVRYKNKVIFKDVPVVQWGSGGNRIEFISLNFKSKAGAPANLHLQIYPRPGTADYIGEFAQISYLPDVPRASVECVGRQ